jgi:ATP-dependent Clp protease adapter protein ClpS
MAIGAKARGLLVVGSLLDDRWRTIVPDTSIYKVLLLNADYTPMEFVVP